MALPELADLAQQGMQWSAAPKHAGRQAHSSSHSSASRSQLADDTAGRAQPDGRECQLCRAKDSDADPIHSDRPYAWAYPPDVTTKKNRGFTCYYCYRVFTARFKAKHKSIEGFVAAQGADMSLVQLFRHWRKIAVDIMTKCGTSNVKVKWGDEAEARQLLKRQIAETRIQDPTDEVWDEADYRREFGNWQTNGHGHKYVDWGDIKGILVPAKKVWKIKRSRISQAEIRECVDNGEFQLGPGQLEQQMADIAGSFLDQRATGVSLDELLAGTSDDRRLPSAPVPPSSAAPAAAGAAPTGASMLSMFPGLSFTAPARPAPAPAVSGGSAAPGRAASRRPGPSGHGGASTRPGVSSSAAASAATPSPSAKLGRAAVDGVGSVDDSVGNKQRGRGRPKEDIGERCEKVLSLCVWGQADSGSNRIWRGRKSQRYDLLTHIQGSAFVSMFVSVCICAYMGAIVRVYMFVCVCGSI